MQNQKQTGDRPGQSSRGSGKSGQGPEADDPTRQTEGQVDDNQDDMGNDVNDPSKPANDINRTGH